jgi:hypothetical protein
MRSIRHRGFISNDLEGDSHVVDAFVSGGLSHDVILLALDQINPVALLTIVHVVEISAPSNSPSAVSNSRRRRLSVERCTSVGSGGVEVQVTAGLARDEEAVLSGGGCGEPA